MTNYNELRDGQEFYGNGYKKGYEDAKKEYARPQGEWQLADKVNLAFIYKCSECGRRVTVYTDSELTNMYPFCHCGADMRKGGIE